MALPPLPLKDIPREGATFTVRGPGLIGDGWSIVCPRFDMLLSIWPEVDCTVVVMPYGSTENDSGVTFPLLTDRLADMYVPAGTVVLLRNAGGDPVFITVREPPLTILDVQ